MKRAIQAAVITKEVNRNPRFAAVIAEEANSNPDFGHRLRAVRFNRENRKITRAPNRRALAMLDPVDVADQAGEAELRAQLSELGTERLKDIVAQYGMDPANLVMKWKTPEKIIDKIVTVSVQRARKGDAFRIRSLKQA